MVQSTNFQPYIKSVMTPDPCKILKIFFSHSTRLLAATTLRNVLGTKNLSEILSEREKISENMQNSLDEATDPWGVKVERVEIKDVRLPVQLQRAMAAEAEAAREARAKVGLLIQGVPQKMHCSFCLICPATNLLEGLDIFHLKVGICSRSHNLLKLRGGY